MSQGPDGDDRPADAPADAHPADTDPADTDPADASPADANPADADPADTDPADANPADASPANADPAADVHPADTHPPDTDPADADPADIDPADADPALARERTELAWTRSSIAFFALGVAILKFRPAAGIPILAFAAVIWLLGHAGRTGNQWIAARRVPLVAAAVTALALVSLVLTLAGPASRGLRP